MFKASILPFIALVFIPALLLFDFSSNSFKINFYLPSSGALLCLAGLVILATTVKMLMATGKRTIAPWDPATILITSGMYSYTRNPMIGGALLVLLGEAAIFGSLAILVWFFLFFIINDLYFCYIEEPDLEKRFGQHYKEYKKAVPKWLPKIKKK
ncbi:MAG: isoprenylcysteine carboxylmethyltransferase family protein [Candidatus Paceibacterota bacterium]|jgi:protein-S-isoprenylcysteine O-methyltransferase Ste14